MNKTQRGFAIIEALLIVVIIAVIGGIGWYAVHTKHQTDKILSQADKISQSTPEKNTKTAVQGSSGSAQAPEYLVIKEWGVKVPINSVAGLSYSFDKQNNMAGFRSSSLDKVSGNCTSNSVTVVRGRANDTYYGETGSGGTYLEVYQNTAKDTLNYKVATKVGDYYYVSPPPGGSCIDLPQTDPKGAALQKQEQDDRTQIYQDVNGMIAQ